MRVGLLHRPRSTAEALEHLATGAATLIAGGTLSVKYEPGPNPNSMFSHPASAIKSSVAVNLSFRSSNELPLNLR